MIQAAAAAAAAGMLVVVEKPLQVGDGDIEQEDTAGTVEVVVAAYNHHMVGKMAVDSDLEEEVAYSGSHMVGGLEAASQTQFCYPLILKVHLRIQIHHVMGQGHPFVEDPWMGRRSSPAEVGLEY